MSFLERSPSKMDTFGTAVLSLSFSMTRLYIFVSFNYKYIKESFAVSSG